MPGLVPGIPLADAGPCLNKRDAGQARPRRSRRSQPSTAGHKTVAGVTGDFMAAEQDGSMAQAWDSPRVTLAVYAAAIFLSAALLFAVQPLFAKMVLPRLGGSPSVWSVAMVFFQ